MEYDTKDEVMFVIKPKFNLLYELVMPTGRKIKNSLFMIIAMVVFYIMLLVLKNYVSFNSVMIGNLDIFTILNLIFAVGILAFSIKAVGHMAFQIMQYNNLSYTFCKDHMIYEDNFLNQHRKTIEYNNIKEVEIRRTVFDRILGYGVIIIYTNAENSNNGMVIYSIKNPQQWYDKIQALLKNKKDIGQQKMQEKVSEQISSIENMQKEEKKIEPIDKEAVEEISEIVNFSEEDEKKFEESLKEINDD